MRNHVLRSTSRLVPRALLAAAVAVPFLFQPVEAGAQQRNPRTDAERRSGERRDAEREARIERLPGGMSISYGFGNRPVLGVTLAEPSRGDTAGVRVESVNPDGPAAKAGLKAGDVITAINGTSLRVSAADVDDPALDGLAGRRLQRVLGRAKAGDNVELRVGSGSGPRVVSVKTVTASELAGLTTTASGNRVMSRGRADDERRGAIGLAIGGSGTLRDTLGLFVSSVVTGGPAEKAGVVEGDRIAAVNGVDVRVPREDVEDPSATSARANRLTREIAKVAPGSAVSLRVYSGGRYREVSVTAVKPSELPSQGFRMSIGDGAFSMTLPPRVMFDEGMGDDLRRRIREGVRLNGSELHIDGEAMRRSMEELRRSLQETGRDIRFQLRDGNDPIVVRTAPRRVIRTTI